MALMEPFNHDLIVVFVNLQKVEKFIHGDGRSVFLQERCLEIHLREQMQRRME